MVRVSSATVKTLVELPKKSLAIAITVAAVAERRIEIRSAFGDGRARLQFLGLHHHE